MTEFYETSGVIKGGRVAVDEPEAMVRALKRWTDGNVTVRVERAHRKRTDAQNKFWHAVVIPEFMKQLNDEDPKDREAFQQMKDALALELIPRTVVDMNGVEHLAPGHTSELDVPEFNSLIERAQRLGARLNVYIPDPGEYIQGAA